MEENKKCIVCELFFIPNHPLKKICSDECFKIRNNENKIKWAKNNPDKVKVTAKKWNDNNTDKKKQSNKNWRKNNPEKCYEDSLRWHKNNPEKCLESSRKWRQNNIEKHRLKSINWYYNNKTRSYDNHKKWRKNNRHHANILKSIRRNRERTATGFHDRIKNFKKKMDMIGECIFCGSKDNLTIEHLIPLSKNGSHEINNLFPSCKRCNSSKGNKDWVEWYRNKEYYSKDRENYILKLFNLKNQDN